jgi:hypothetical protein
MLAAANPTFCPDDEGLLARSDEKLPKEKAWA